MKIAFLTLRVDNNYGGNLQRFALSRFLQKMGHDVTYLYFRSEWNNENLNIRIKKMIEYFVKSPCGFFNTHLLYWKHEDPNWEKKRINTFPFFQKYVKHSPLIWSFNALKKYIEKENFDAYIVGSDQVWRKCFTQRWGLERFFLDFVPQDKIKVFYAASFGIIDGDYSLEDVALLTPLYKQFDAVSVREDSALLTLKKYGWTCPQANLVLDPTLLLGKNEYEGIVESSNTTCSSGNMFCYVLDMNQEIEKCISAIAKEKKLTPFYATLTGKHSMSIEQWLRSFMDSEYIVTDSYHGMVFSLIFNKPFYLLYNDFRGNARFDSLIRIIDTPINMDSFNWEKINKNITMAQMKSRAFIEKALT